MSGAPQRRVRGEPKEVVSTKLDRELREQVDEFVSDSGSSRSAAIAHLIKTGLDQGAETEELFRRLNEAETKLALVKAAVG